MPVTGERAGSKNLARGEAMLRYARAVDEISDPEVATIARAVVLNASELNSGEAVIEAESPAQGAYLAGWWHAAVRQSLGVIVLADAGLAYESLPLLRGIVEHAVLVELVSRRKDLWRVAERARRYKYVQFEAWLESKQYDSWPDLVRARKNLDRPTGADNPRDDGLSSFKAQCEALGEDGDLHYARYQYLTHHSHASVESAMTFVQPPGCDCVVCRGHLPMESPTAEALAAIMVLEIGARLNAHLPGEPWGEALAAMESECEPIRAAMGGAPLHVNRPAPPVHEEGT